MGAYRNFRDLGDVLTKTACLRIPPDVKVTVCGGAAPRGAPVRGWKLFALRCPRPQRLSCGAVARFGPSGILCLRAQIVISPWSHPGPRTRPARFLAAGYAVVGEAAGWVAGQRGPSAG